MQKIKLSPDAQRDDAIDQASQTYQRIMGKLPAGPISQRDQDKIAITHKSAFRAAIKVYEDTLIAHRIFFNEAVETLIKSDPAICIESQMELTES